ncbi:hypothetical protein JL722_10741 [Aureococcus anophagefferens]|nr:hypothetical protein JL722_10741 [Aureococcus anophagefferens]
MKSTSSLKNSHLSFAKPLGCPTMATQVELAHEDSVAAFYKIQNCDENGEYRANKYNRTLGTAFLPPAAHVPALPATAPLDDLVAAVAAHGAVVLKGAIPVGDVAAFRAAHDAALAELKPLRASSTRARPRAARRGERVLLQGRAPRAVGPAAAHDGPRPLRPEAP